MDDDFNTALAIGHIFELIRLVNRYLDGKPMGSRAVELVSRASDLLKEAGGVLNIFRRTPAEWSRSMLAIKCPGLSEEFIISKIEERRAARDKKDWAVSDAVRKELEERGIIVEDKKEDTGWKVKIV
jgi:cysteinyl-tRNA synthetase